jgi:hypothetical protein
MKQLDHLPNFLILGAAKAGTTALYHYLNQHPQIYMTPLKETNFFALEGQPLNFSGPGDDDYVNRMSITTLDAYKEQFDGVRDEIAVGEASPLYLYDERAARNIYRYVPDAKLIIILRNPIDRAYSAFLHLVRDGREEFADFGTALQREDERIRAGWEHLWHLKQMGLYYEQVKRYYDLFPREQIKTYLYYDFRTQPQVVLQELYGFFGVDETHVTDMSCRHNEATVPKEQRPPLLPEVRQQLQDEMRDDILKVQDLIGRDLSHWLTSSKREAESPVAQ